MIVSALVESLEQSHLGVVNKLCCRLGGEEGVASKMIYYRDYLME